MSEINEEPKPRARRKVTPKTNLPAEKEKETSARTFTVIGSSERDFSEAEAINNAKDNGISPAVTVSILNYRNYIIAGIAALTAVALFVVGILSGLGIANGIANDMAEDNFNNGLISLQDQQLPQGDTWFNGYKEGIVEGYELGVKRGDPGFLDGDSPTQFINEPPQIDNEPGFGEFTEPPGSFPGDEGNIETFEILPDGTIQPVE